MTEEPAVVLRRAGHSYRTLRADVRRGRRVAAVAEAVAAWLTDQPAASAGVIRRAQPLNEDEIERETARIWLDRPSRYRFELDSSAFPQPLIHIVTPAGEWSRNPWSGAAAMDSSAPDGAGHEILERAPLRELWNPEPLIPLLRFDSSHRISFRQRAALQIVARPAAAVTEEQELIWPGADEYELVVDVERGVLLRLGARLHATEFAFEEVESIVFDEPIDESVFQVTNT